MNPIIQYLTTEGPCLSSEIVRFLQETGVKPEAARKRISRLPDEVRRLKSGFPKNEAFLYLESQWNTPQYFDRLRDALKKTGSALGRALIALEARNGCVEHPYFPIFSGLPIKNVKKQLSHALVEKRLHDLNLISFIRAGRTPFVLLTNSAKAIDRRKAVTLAEDVVLQGLKSSLANLGVVSSKSVKIRLNTPLPEFGPFNWDLVGPSYLHNLATRTATSAQNAFVVADILLDRKVTLEDLVPFFHKCDTIQNQKRHRKFLPIFVADWFERPALMELRKRGYVVGTISNLLGRDRANHLRVLIRTIRNAAAALSKNRDQFFALIDSLSRSESASLNLHTLIFDFLIAHLYVVRGYGIDFRQRIMAPNH